MEWWIGQVTDPKKGKWEDALEKTQADDGEEIYSHRCRVRIVGYHGCEDDLPDDQLPLAHVLYHLMFQPLEVVVNQCSIKVERL